LNMKYVHFIILLVTIGVSPGNGFVSMSVSLDNDVYAPGDPVLAAVTLTNTGDETVAVKDFRDTAGNYRNLDFTVVCNGCLIPLEKPAFDANRNVVFTVDLEPGQTYGDTVDLNGWGFDAAITKFTGGSGNREVYTIATYQCLSSLDPGYEFDWETGPINSNTVQLKYPGGILRGKPAWAVAGSAVA